MLLPVKGDPPRYIYVPNPGPQLPPATQLHFMAVSIHERLEAQRGRDRRQRDFLEQNRRWQSACRCGHRQYAHEDGAGACGAKKCPCREFVP
jgi:hypothetical protein